MCNQEYNGNTNYETWSVGLNLDNESQTHDDCTSRAKEMIEEALEQVRYDLAKWLEEYVAVNLIEGQIKDKAYLVSQLVQAALSEVDWDDLAEGYITTALENRR